MDVKGERTTNDGLAAGRIGSFEGSGLRGVNSTVEVYI